MVIDINSLLWKQRIKKLRLFVVPVVGGALWQI